MRTTPQTLSAGPVDAAVLESLFDRVPDTAFFIKDAEGRYVAVNESLVARHGLRDKSQVIGKRPCDICPGEYGGGPSRQDADVLRSGRPIVDLLEMHWYAPHEPGWCLTTKLPLRDAGGEIVGLIGVSRDLRAPVDPRAVPRKVAEALNRLESRLDEVKTPADLARMAGMPPHRFARLMKRLFGLTPVRYILKARITAATRMLRETGDSVADVALACGFYDHSAFSRAFRRATGRTPSEMRG
jgi:AraC-like DNA-binding protein